MPAFPIPVRRVPLLCGPVGTSPVLSAYPRAMARAVRRGTGPNGTRGNPVPALRGSSAQQIPFSAIPQAQIDSFPYGVSARGAAWPFGDEPVGGEEMLDGFRPQMRAGSRRVGMGETLDLSSDGYARKTRDMGSAIQAMTLVKQLSKSACSQGTSYGFSDRTAWVDKGCRGTFDINVGGDNEAQLYKTATDVVNRFVASLSAGQVDPSSSVPGNADGLPPNVNPANAALYSSYQSAVSSLASARLQGQAMWKLLHPDPITTTGTTTTASPGATAAAQPQLPYGSAISMQPGVELTPINAPAPSGVDPIYGASPDIMGTTAYVQSPFQTKPVASPVAPAQKPRGKVGGAAVGLGALVVVAGIFALLHHKKRAHA